MPPQQPTPEEQQQLSDAIAERDRELGRTLARSDTTTLSGAQEQADRAVDAALVERDRAGGALLSAQDRARAADVALGRALGRRDLIRELEAEARGL